MNIHVIISTHNGSPWIEKCISSLLSSSIPLKVQVIDNVSTDNTLEIVKTRFPQVEITPNPVDIGFGKANNILIRKALQDKADYVFLLNQDAWVDRDTIEGLVKIHQNNPQYGILSPVHLNGAGSGIDHLFSIYCRHAPGFLSDLYLNKLKDVYDIDFINAALWLVPTGCLYKAGLFDPIFSLYGEDMDLAKRIKMKGYKIGLAPALRGYHDRENRPPSIAHTRRIKKIKYINFLKDTKKKFPKVLASYLLTFTQNFFGDLFRLKVNSSYHELKIGMSVMRSLNKIIQSRKECIKDGAYITSN